MSREATKKAPNEVATLAEIMVIGRGDAVRARSPLGGDPVSGCLGPLK
jgi:hypothetical protein